VLAEHPWSRVDELLDDVRSAAVEADTLPESLALIFHEGRLTAVLETPPFVAEDADRITRVLCRFLPSTMADQIAVVWPAGYQAGGETLWAMKVHLWERTKPSRMRTRIIPVSIKGSVDGPSFEIKPPDPWSRRLAKALPRPPRTPGVIDTRFPPGFEYYVTPTSPMSEYEPLHLDN